MNHHRNTPVYPGAMTPAQILRRAAITAASVATTAAFIAAMLATAIIFN